MRGAVRKGGERAGARGTPGDERAEPRASPLAEVRASASSVGGSTERWYLNKGQYQHGRARLQGNLRVGITRARAAQSRSVHSMEISWAPAMYVIA